MIFIPYIRYKQDKSIDIKIIKNIISYLKVGVSFLR